MAQGKHRNVTIYAEPDPARPGEYLFSMHDGIGKTNDLTFNKEDDGMWKWENYKITFTLENKPGANLKFSQDINKVLYAERTQLPNPPSPTSQQMGGVFYVAKQSDIKDLELEVTNSDRIKERFAFGFNFLLATQSDGPGVKYYPYDPIGNNQNGGWPRSFAMLVPATIGGTTVGAVVGAAAAMLLNPASSTINTLWGAIIGAIGGYVIGLILSKPSAAAAQSAPHA